MLYKSGAFENNPMPNQSRFSICGTLRLHYFVRVFSEAFFRLVSLRTLPNGDCGRAKFSEQIILQHLYHVTFFRNVISDAFRIKFGKVRTYFGHFLNFIRNASQMHQKYIRNLSQIQIKTQYFFKISLPYALKLINYQVSIVKSKFMEINLSKTLQNCCK